MLWGDVWQGVVGQKVWILPDSTRQSFFRAGDPLSSKQKRSYLWGFHLFGGRRGAPRRPVGARRDPWGPATHGRARLYRNPFGSMGVINR